MFNDGKSPVSAAMADEDKQGIKKNAFIKYIICLPSPAFINLGR